MKLLQRLVSDIADKIIGEDNLGECERSATESDAPRPDLVALIKEGWCIKQRQDADAKRLIAVNDALKSIIKPGEAVVIDGVQVRNIERTTLEITEVGRLMDALGSRFQDLVEIKTKFGVTDKLEDLAFSGDGGVVQEEIRACIAIRTLNSINYRAMKKAA